MSGSRGGRLEPRRNTAPPSPRSGLLCLKTQSLDAVLACDDEEQLLTRPETMCFLREEVRRRA